MDRSLVWVALARLLIASTVVATAPVLGGGGTRQSRWSQQPSSQWSGGLGVADDMPLGQGSWHEPEPEPSSCPPSCADCPLPWNPNPSGAAEQTAHLRVVHLVEAASHNEHEHHENDPRSLKFRVEVGRRETAPIFSIEVQYAVPSIYQPLPTSTAEGGEILPCSVSVSSWLGSEQPPSCANEPQANCSHNSVAVQTNLKLIAGRHYTLLVVGRSPYDETAVQSPDGRIQGPIPGLWSNVYAVLLEDDGPPPRAHLGSVRVVHASPSTAPLQPWIGQPSWKDRNQKRSKPLLGKHRNVYGVVRYVCQQPCKPSDAAKEMKMGPPRTEEERLHRKCPTFPFNAPPPVSAGAFCIPQKSGKELEHCPGVDAQSGKPITCASLQSSWNSLQSCKKCPCGGQEPCDATKNGSTCGGQPCQCSWSECQLCACPGDDPSKVSPAPPSPGCGLGGVQKDWRGVNQSAFGCNFTRTFNVSDSDDLASEEKRDLQWLRPLDGTRRRISASLKKEGYPWVAVPAGVYCLSFKDGDYQFPYGPRVLPLYLDVNIGPGEAVTVILFGQPPRKREHGVHKDSPLSMIVLPSFNTAGFASLRFAGTPGTGQALSWQMNHSHWDTVEQQYNGVNMIPGHDDGPYLRSGAANSWSQPKVDDGTLSTAIQSRTGTAGEWSAGTYRLGWLMHGRPPVNCSGRTDSDGELTLDDNEAALVFLAPKKKALDQSLSCQKIKHKLPDPSVSVTGAYVRVINAAAGAGALTVVAKPEPDMTGDPILLARGVSYLESFPPQRQPTPSYHRIDRSQFTGGSGSFTLEVNATVDGAEVSVVQQPKLQLYAGIVYTVLLQNYSTTPKLQVVTAIDRYLPLGLGLSDTRKPAARPMVTVRTRLGYLGVGNGSDAVELSVRPLLGAANETQTTSVTQNSQHQLSKYLLVNVSFGSAVEVSIYASFFCERGRKQPNLNSSVPCIKRRKCWSQVLHPAGQWDHHWGNSGLGSPQQQQQEAYTFVVWGNSTSWLNTKRRQVPIADQFVCRVKQLQDLLRPPATGHSGLRLIADMDGDFLDRGQKSPAAHSFTDQNRALQLSPNVVVSADGHQPVAVPSPLGRADTGWNFSAMGVLCGGGTGLCALREHGLYTALVRRADVAAGRLGAHGTLRTDHEYGCHVPFVLRFLNAADLIKPLTLRLTSADPWTPELALTAPTPHVRTTQPIAGTLYRTGSPCTGNSVEQDDKDGVAAGQAAMHIFSDTAGFKTVQLPFVPPHRVQLRSCPPHCSHLSATKVQTVSTRDSSGKLIAGRKLSLAEAIKADIDKDITGRHTLLLVKPEPSTQETSLAFLLIPDGKQAPRLRQAFVRVINVIGESHNSGQQSSVSVTINSTASTTLAFPAVPHWGQSLEKQVTAPAQYTLRVNGEPVLISGHHAKLSLHPGVFYSIYLFKDPTSTSNGTMSYVARLESDADYSAGRAHVRFANAASWLPSVNDATLTYDVINHELPLSQPFAPTLYKEASPYLEVTVYNNSKYTVNVGDSRASMELLPGRRWTVYAVPEANGLRLWPIEDLIQDQTSGGGDDIVGIRWLDATSKGAIQPWSGHACARDGKDCSESVPATRQDAAVVGAPYTNVDVRTVMPSIPFRHYIGLEARFGTQGNPAVPADKPKLFYDGKTGEIQCGFQPADKHSLLATTLLVDGNTSTNLLLFIDRPGQPASFFAEWWLAFAVAVVCALVMAALLGKLRTWYKHHRRCKPFKHWVEGTSVDDQPRGSMLLESLTGSGRHGDAIATGQGHRCGGWFSFSVWNAWCVRGACVFSYRRRQRERQQTTTTDTSEAITTPPHEGGDSEATAPKLDAQW